jgi:riboflavin biosynthesis pyrimidine reductase
MRPYVIIVSEVSVDGKLTLYRGSFKQGTDEPHGYGGIQVFTRDKG